MPVEAGRLSFWQRAQLDGDRVAVVDPDGSEVTAGQLLTGANRLANVFDALGITQSSCVAAMLPNHHVMLEAILAATQLGLYITPVNYHLQAGEVAYMLRDSGARILLASERFPDAIAKAAEDVGIPSIHRIALQGKVSGFVPLAEVVGFQLTTPPSVRSAGRLMPYTSGTTGAPKGIRRELPKVDPDVAAVEAANDYFSRFPPSPEAETGPHLVVGPFHHAHPLMNAIHSLHRGRSLVLTEKWDSEQVLALIERYGVTSTAMVPTMFQRLLQLPVEARQRYDISSLRRIIHAGAPCPVHVKVQMIEWMGPILDEYYAATEGGGTSVTSADWQQRPGTVGRAYPGARVRVLDAAGRDTPTGQPGKVYMWMKQPFEYYKDPDKTQASRLGDFFTVGDIGFLDADGYLFLCDREADVIISGGVNIYPAEVEAVLIGHPIVLDAAVIGVPNEEWGEEVKALVSCKSGSGGAAEIETILIEHCRANLARYKCPRSIDLVGELPRSESGKLARKELRQRYWAASGRKL